MNRHAVINSSTSSPSTVLNPRIHHRPRFLLPAPLTRETKTNYRKAVVEFLQYIDDVEGDAHTTEEFDDLLLDYIHYLYGINSTGKSKASHTLYGILTYIPSLKLSLPGSKKAVRNWSKIHKNISYPPLTWQLTMIIALQLTRRGFRDMAIAVLLGFDCLLRIGELLGIRIGDVADEADGRISSEHKGMLIRLRHTKTGDNKWVQVLNPDIIYLVRSMIFFRRRFPSTSTATIDDELLFDYSQDKFRRTFKSICSELGLSSKYVPHSLRHGGATYYFFVRKMTMEDVLMRGRWASVDSARLYIQAGAAVLLGMKLPLLLKELGTDLEKPGNLIEYLSLAQKH
jgi:integrase